MKVTKNMIKLVEESRGGDAPFGWSEDAIHLKVFGITVETYRSSHRHLVAIKAEEWRKAITEWKEK